VRQTVGLPQEKLLEVLDHRPSKSASLLAILSKDYTMLVL